jgi:hypothetical protein
MNTYRNLARCHFIQGDSFARGPKLLSIKNYVIEIITWTFIYTYRERWKTGPAHNRCWKWSPFTSKHTWMRYSNSLGLLARELRCTTQIPNGFACNLIWVSNWRNRQITTWPNDWPLLTIDIILNYVNSFSLCIREYTVPKDNPFSES